MTAAERTDEIPIPPGLLRLASPSEEETLDEELPMSTADELVKKVDDVARKVDGLVTDMRVLQAMAPDPKRLGALEIEVATLRARGQLIGAVLGIIGSTALIFAVQAFLSR